MNPGARREVSRSGAKSAALRRRLERWGKGPPCDAIVSIGEGLNYVDSPESVPPTRQLFERVARALSPGGLLIFDVMVRSRSGLRGYRSWSAGPDWACLVEVAPHENGQALRRGITTFRLVDGAYRRGAEDHWVYRFSTGALTRELREAGFEVRTASGYGNDDLPPGRRLFHCTRANASRPRALERTNLQI